MCVREKCFPKKNAREGVAPYPYILFYMRFFANTHTSYTVVNDRGPYVVRARCETGARSRWGLREYFGKIVWESAKTGGAQVTMYIPEHTRLSPPCAARRLSANTPSILYRRESPGSWGSKDQEPGMVKRFAASLATGGRP